jgi:hypothetical protein
MNTADFLKQRTGLIKNFSTEGLEQLAAGSRAGSFAANGAIAHHGAGERSPCGSGNDCWQAQRWSSKLSSVLNQQPVRFSRINLAIPGIMFFCLKQATKG